MVAELKKVTIQVQQQFRANICGTMEVPSDLVTALPRRAEKIPARNRLEVKSCSAWLS